MFKFGAINCAQQNCDSYGINGTPTLRLFYGMGAAIGIDVTATLDLDQLRTSLLEQLEIAQSYGFMKSEKLPNFLLVSYEGEKFSRMAPHKLSFFFLLASSGLRKSLPDTKKMVAYVVESDNVGVLGRDVVFHASKDHPELEVRRMDWIFASNSIVNFRGLPLPVVLLVPVFQKKPDW